MKASSVWSTRLYLAIEPAVATLKPKRAISSWIPVVSVGVAGVASIEFVTLVSAKIRSSKLFCYVCLSV